MIAPIRAARPTVRGSRSARWSGLSSAVSASARSAATGVRRSCAVSASSTSCCSQRGHGGPDRPAGQQVAGEGRAADQQRRTPPITSSTSRLCPAASSRRVGDRDHRADVLQLGARPAQRLDPHPDQLAAGAPLVAADQLRPSRTAVAARPLEHRGVHRHAGALGRGRLEGRVRRPGRIANCGQSLLISSSLTRPVSMRRRRGTRPAATPTEVTRRSSGVDAAASPCSRVLADHQPGEDDQPDGVHHGEQRGEHPAQPAQPVGRGSAHGRRSWPEPVAAARGRCGSAPARAACARSRLHHHVDHVGHRVGQLRPSSARSGPSAIHHLLRRGRSGTPAPRTPCPTG